MNRFFSYLLGPEMLWVLFCAVVWILVARNTPPTEAGSRQLETLSWFLVMGFAALSFLPLAWASSPSMPGNAWWMLLRIAIAGGIGICIIVTKLCGGIDYGDSRNSGLGAAFFVWIGLGWIILCGGVFLSAIWILVKARASHP